MTDQAIRPCRIDVPQADLDDLRERLTRTRWTSPAPDGGDYGVALPYVAGAGLAGLAAVTVLAARNTDALSVGQQESS